MTKTDGIFPPLAIGIRTGAGGVDPRFTNITGYQGHAGEVNLVGYFKVTSHARGATKHAVIANPGATCNSDFGRHCAVITNLYVVGNLNQVVQLYAVAYCGVVQGATVYGGSGAGRRRGGWRQYHH